MDQTQKPRYVSRFEPLALHPRLHHRVGFPIHYLPPREPLPKRICYNSRSTKLLSQTTTSQPRGRPVANTTTITSTEEGYNHQAPPHNRGSKQQSPPLPKREQTNNPITQPQPLPKREQPRNQGFTTSGFFQPQTISLFSQNKILIE